MTPVFTHNGPITNTSLRFAGYVNDNEVAPKAITINSLYLGLESTGVLLRTEGGLPADRYNDIYELRAHLKELVNNLPTA